MKIPIDKQAHFWWGVAMCALLAHLDIDLRTAIAIAGLIGLMKEVFDSRTHEADGEDFLSTMLGAFVAGAFVWVTRL